MVTSEGFGVSPRLLLRTGGRAVECTGLENQQGCKPFVGSNPTLSANYPNRLFGLTLWICWKLAVLLYRFGLHGDSLWTVVFLRLI